MRSQISSLKLLFFLAVLLLLLVPPAAFPQGMTAYPAAVDDAASLPIPVDDKVASLTVALTSSATTATVNSTAGFPSEGICVIEREQFAYTGKTSTTFIGLTRGFGGTTARPHTTNVSVRSGILSAHVSGNRSAIIEVEKKLGTGVSNYSSAAPGDVLTINEDGTSGWAPASSSSGDGLTDDELRASPVPVSGTFFQATQPVSIASMPSTPVTGTFFQATQPVSIASMPSTPVTGTFWQATQPVSGPLTDTQLRATAVPISAASLPLPTGASTEATLALIKAKTDNIDVALSTRTK